MRDIRDSLQSDLDRWLNLALSLTTIEIFGETQLHQLVSQNPKHLISIGVGNPPPPGRQKWYAEDLLKEFQNNKGIVQEIVHGYLIQIWYEFLGKIFQEILNQHFSGENSYPQVRKKIRIDLDLSQDNPTTIFSNIQRKAVKWFDFLDNVEKISLIEKCLNKQIANQLKSCIKKHIVVRNVIQHNQGVLRDEDLNKLGLQGRNITLINDSQQNQTYNKGDRVMISYWEVEAVKNDLYQAANQLIP